MRSSYSYFILFIIILNVVSYNSIKSQDSIFNYNGEYFGQELPGKSPKIFLPEFKNIFGYIHGRFIFSPSGNEAIWIISTNDKGRSIDHKLIIRRNENNAWHYPKKLFLNNDNEGTSPSYSGDGKRIFFQSRFKVNEKCNDNDLNLCYVEKNDTTYSNPKNLGDVINTCADESRPYVSNDNSIFFCRNKVIKNLIGDSDIYFSQYQGNAYNIPICLGSEINTEFHETEPCISPDDSYLLFISNRPGGYSKMMNLYVSYKDDKGNWTKSFCLSDTLKIENIWFPSITPDGKYLIFCGGYPTEHGYNNSNYYWVSTELIKDLNPFQKEKNIKSAEENFIKIICDDNVKFSNYISDFGFSCVIAYNGEMILFDTGSAGNKLLNNLKASEINPLEITNVFISHNHSDHIGGLKEFMDINNNVNVYMSKEKTQNTVGKGVEIFNEALKSCLKHNKILIEQDYFYKIAENIYSTGFIETSINNRLIKEQSLVIETENGLVVITGCSHQGLIEITKRVKKRFNKPIYMILGGFHLMANSKGDERIISILNELKRLEVKKCCPIHCTDLTVREMFKEYFKTDFVEASAGETVKLGGN